MKTEGVTENVKLIEQNKDRMKTEGVTEIVISHGLKIETKEKMKMRDGTKKVEKYSLFKKESVS